MIIPVSSDTECSLSLPPIVVEGPVSIVLGNDTEEGPDCEDDLLAEDDNIIDFDELDDFEDGDVVKGGDHDE